MVCDLIRGVNKATKPRPETCKAKATDPRPGMRKYIFPVNVKVNPVFQFRVMEARLLSTGLKVTEFI